MFQWKLGIYGVLCKGTTALSWCCFAFHLLFFSVDHSTIYILQCSCFVHFFWAEGAHRSALSSWPICSNPAPFIANCDTLCVHTIKTSFHTSQMIHFFPQMHQQALVALDPVTGSLFSYFRSLLVSPGHHIRILPHKGCGWWVEITFKTSLFIPWQNCSKTLK